MTSTHAQDAFLAEPDVPQARRGITPSLADLPSMEEIFAAGDDRDVPREHRKLLRTVRQRLIRAQPHPDTGAPGEPLTPAELAQLQAAQAIWATYAKPSEWLHFPWRSLREICGPVQPKELLVAGARTGGGKTMFALNLLDSVVRDGLPTLVMTLEQDAAQVRGKWAALALGLDPDAVATQQWASLPAGSRQGYIDHLLWQAEQASLVQFTSDHFVTRQVLEHRVEDAARDGVRLVLVDHVHRIQHGAGVNPFEEFSATIRAAKELAKRHNVIIVLLAQFNRGPIRDPVQRLMTRPQLSDLQGGGTIEQEADIVLGLFRRPRFGLSSERIADFRQGRVDWRALVEPNVLGLATLKHRRADCYLGREATLAVHHGRIADLDAAEHMGVMA